MAIRLVEQGGLRLVECVEPVTRIEDALDLIAACAEHGADRVLLESRNLPEAFFDLRSRFAGEFIQKFENYSIRLALVLESDLPHGDKFEAFVVEARHGRRFRAFSNRGDAEAWLFSA